MNIRKNLLKTLIFCLTFITFTVQAMNVSTEAELQSCLAEENNECILTNDITLTERITIGNDTKIKENTYTIDLQGHTLTSNFATTRAIKNYSNLTIKNGKMVNTNSTSYGMIDNWFGKVTIDKVNFEDAGAGDGATIKNRTGIDSETNEKVYGILTITDSDFKNTGENNGNAGTYSDGIMNVSNTKYTSSSNRAYCLITNTGESTITNTVTDGTHGGLGINSGKVVINGGTYTAKNYYGIWITNNNSSTNVVINDGNFKGMYGLYSSVDDGRQDNSDAVITINNGNFEGTTKAAAAVNSKGSDYEWIMTIKGGTYSTSVAEYVAKEYVEKQDGDKYVVTKKEVKPNTDSTIDNNAAEIVNDFIYQIINNDDIPDEFKAIKDQIGTILTQDDIKIEVTTDSQNESDIDETLKSSITDKAKTIENTKIAGFYDINVVLFAGTNSVNIPLLNKKITLGIDLPDTIEAPKSNVTRTYYVIRYHNGEVSIIDAKLEGNKVIFDSDRFSTYALAYTDTENLTPEDSSNSKDNENITPSNPNTSDNILISFVIVGITIPSIMYLVKKFN